MQFSLLELAVKQQNVFDIYSLLLYQKAIVFVLVSVAVESFRVTKNVMVQTDKVEMHAALPASASVVMVLWKVQKSATTRTE